MARWYRIFTGVFPLKRPNNVYCIVYVDDIVIISSDKEGIVQLKLFFSKYLENKNVDTCDISLV